MDKLKNLTIPQMALIIGGALLLRKVLNTKVAIVAKNDSPLDLLPALALESEFDTVKNETVLPLVSSQSLEIKTPFNTSEILENNLTTQKFTNEYFK